MPPRGGAHHDRRACVCRCVRFFNHGAARRAGPAGDRHLLRDAGRRSLPLSREPQGSRGREVDEGTGRLYEGYPRRPARAQRAARTDPRASPGRYAARRLRAPRSALLLSGDRARFRAAEVDVSRWPVGCRASPDRSIDARQRHVDPLCDRLLHAVVGRPVHRVRALGRGLGSEHAESDGRVDR